MKIPENDENNKQEKHLDFKEIDKFLVKKYVRNANSLIKSKFIIRKI